MTIQWWQSDNVIYTIWTVYFCIIKRAFKKEKYFLIMGKEKMFGLT